MTLPLMPKATAIWLVDNTALSFKQIADFCGMHELEIKGIADGEVGIGIKGLNPITNNQLAKEEIERCENDSDSELQIIINEASLKTDQSKKKNKYTPLSKRQDKPDSALWLIKNHSKLKDSQIAKLVGVTSSSVKAIRNKSYWNFNNLNPKDPVAMGLFSQKDLLESLEKADRRIKREQKQKQITNLK